jgi:hypothetical protein
VFVTAVRSSACCGSGRRTRSERGRQLDDGGTDGLGFEIGLDRREFFRLHDLDYLCGPSGDASRRSGGQPLFEMVEQGEEGEEEAGEPDDSRHQQEDDLHETTAHPGASFVDR